MYRQAFPGITHTQYLDETTYEERQWMTHIHHIVETIRDKNEADAIDRAKNGR